MNGFGQLAKRSLLQILDVTLILVISLGAKTRRIQPTKRSNLTSKPDVRDKLLSQQKGRCAYCSTPISVRRGNYEIDHKTPLARQGDDTIGNLQALCRACNKEKSARTHTEYQHYRRYGSERPSYVEFRRKPKYLKPRESFVRLSLPMIVGAVIGGLFFGALTIEQPLWGGATLGILAVAWAISAYLRGMNTGALKDSVQREADALVGERWGG